MPPFNLNNAAIGPAQFFKYYYTWNNTNRYKWKLNWISNEIIKNGSKFKSSSPISQYKSHLNFSLLTLYLAAWFDSMSWNPTNHSISDKRFCLGQTNYGVDSLLIMGPAVIHDVNHATKYPLTRHSDNKLGFVVQTTKLPARLDQ